MPVTLTDEQYALLRAEARRTGLSLAELVRRAIDESYPAPASTEDRLHGLERSFGAWKDRTFDGAEYVDRMRRGMARRLDRALPDL